MQLIFTLIVSTATAFLAAYTIYKDEQGWFPIFLAYVGGGNLALSICCSVVFLFSYLEDEWSVSGSALTYDDGNQAFTGFLAWILHTDFERDFFEWLHLSERFAE